ncbi:hypothetical protein SDJN02_20813, partial [Cucurbita argyrosperma subsp. argyrosperma]
MRSQMMNREALVLFRVKLKSATAPGPLFSVSAMLNLKSFHFFSEQQLTGQKGKMIAELVREK